MNSSSGLSTTSRTKTNQNVQVYVRVRPLNTRERLIRSHEVVEVSSTKEIISRQMPESKVTKKFTFDRTFGPDSTQVEVYQCVVAPLIEEVIAGYNCTVFAYGQTGTGKTHTMVGEECPNLRSSWEDQTSVGIIPRALSHLFDELRLMEVEFSMRISYLEIYNEELCDLLSTDDSTQIRIFDNAQKKGTVIIQGLEEVPVHSKEDVYKLLEKGQDRRKTATTLMNAQSSRSHTVFSILVHIKENGIEGEEMLKIGKLNLVDLAGSENISKAGNEKGIRTRETVNINQSLLTLGRCITALVERTPHIPYRESKLTRLLQESLGGRTKTSIIATISPGHKDLEETLSTLEYAHRAKHIQNKPELNQKLTKKVVIKEYSEEIERLRKELVACREKNGIYLPDDTFNELQYKLDSQNRELNEKILLLKALKDDLASKERLFNEVSLNLVEKTEELKQKDKHLLETKTELDKTKKVLTTTKKRYKEKKFLLQNHVKTEQELFNQAKKLVEVADVATTDTVQLHDTIYRRKMVDTKIRTACEKFVDKMQGNFGQMKNNFSDFEDKHKKCSKVMHEQMSKYMQDYKRFTNELVGKLTLISTLQKDSTKIVQLFESLVKNVSHIKDDSIEEVRTLVNKIQQEQAERETECQEYIEGLLDLIRKGQHDWTNNNSKLLDFIEENRTLTSTFISENSMLIENNTKRHENELKLEINTLISTFTQQEKISESRQNAIDSMQKEFEKFYTTMQSLEAEEQMSRVNLVNISKNLETSNSVTAKNFHNVKENLESFALTNEQKSEELRTKVQDANDELSSLLDVETTKINEFNETVMKDRRKYGNDMSSLQILDECNINKMSAKVQSMEKEIRKTHEYFCEQVNNACNESECLIRLDDESASNHYTQVSALGSSLLGNLVDYKINCEAVTDECKRNIEEFHRNEFKPYTPTGQTPVKREFSYPRTLAATASHNSLLHRFRTEQEWSDLDTTTSSITEDCEPTLHDLSNDKVMLYSTPKSKAEELKVLKTSSSSVVTSFSDENFNSSQKNSSTSILSVKEEDKENVF